jgi:arylsulfatase A-like enzyme
MASVVLAAPTTLVGGRRLVSRDSPVATRDRTTIRFTADPALQTVGTPTCPSSSSLRIVAGTYDSGEVALPCTGWVPSGRGGYRYVAGSDGAGGVRKLSVGAATLSATLAGPIHLPVPSNAPFVEVRLVLGGVETCGRLVALAPNGTTTFRAVGPSTACTAMPPRPNFLVVNLDDTRADGVDLMPVLQARVADEGHTFANAFTPNALCCPSRASVLTGRYALHHGTRTLAPPMGGAQRFRALGADQETIAVWLQRAGYHTGLFGKYLNAYDAATEGGLGPGGGLYVPPGWDRWWAMVSPEKYGGVHGLTYTVTEEDGTLTVLDDHSSDAQYSTDLSAQEMRDFVNAAVAAGRPFLAYWSPIASHSEGVGPPAPAARHRDLMLGLPLWRPPSWGEADLSDKPRSMTPPSLDPIGLTDLMRQRGYEALLAVDEQLGAFLDLVDGLGVGDDTVVILTSDNGVGWGEHNLFFQAKTCPYEVCQRVPYVVRYPRLGAAGIVREEAVLNIDVAPTLAALAGVVPPPVDGESLVPLLTGDASSWRSDYLMEFWRPSCGDKLALTSQPIDGDQVRLFHGDPWAVSPRPSVVFEFDAGDGVTAPGTILVPIQASVGQTTGTLAATVTASVPGVRHVPNFFGLAIVEDATGACNGPLWWEEVDQGGVIVPTNPPPAYFGVRDVERGYTWVEYETGERELYDLAVDPHQLESRHDDPQYAAIRAELSARTAALRTQ